MGIKRMELEQRMINILKKDSRRSIMDLSDELHISRVTAKKTLNSLIESGKIIKFTILLNEDQENLVLLHIKEIDSIKDQLILESYELMDGTFLIVTYYENLPLLKDSKIMDIRFARKRHINLIEERSSQMHCDYCGKEIEFSPIIFEIAGRTYYVCCPNCEKDLKKGKTSMEEENIN